jgi:hypothetical protein
LIISFNITYCVNRFEVISNCFQVMKSKIV